MTTCEAVKMLDFAKQECDEGFLAEAQPLFLRHWMESGRMDVEFSPSFGDYLALQKSGMLHVFTARANGVLVGYSFFIVRSHLYYSSSTVAVNDLAFLEKQYRYGMEGYRFLKWCDEQIKDMGASIVVYGTTGEPDLGVLFRRLGCSKTREIYERRIR